MRLLKAARTTDIANQPVDLSLAELAGFDFVTEPSHIEVMRITTFWSATPGSHKALF
jgi:hypothetical protein